MLRHIALTILAMLSACSSNHDLKRDGFNIFGGGFIDDQIGPGLHLIKAFSNTSPLATPDSAAKTFDNRARQLCPTGYTEVRVVSDAYKSMTPGPMVQVPNQPGLSVQGPGPVVTSKIGHVLCNNSPITLHEAKALVTPENE
jgi:hypothetical protein